MDAQEVLIALEESPSLEHLILGGVSTEMKVAIVTELAKRFDLVPSLRFFRFDWRRQLEDSSLLQSLQGARPQLIILTG